MNGGSKSWMLFTAPITLILALVVAIPLVFSDDCDPALASNTGPTSDAISIMSWNLCVSSCGRFNKRVGPAMEQVAGVGPDIVSVQEAVGDQRSGSTRSAASSRSATPAPTKRSPTSGATTSTSRPSSLCCRRAPSPWAATTAWRGPSSAPRPTTPSSS